MPATTTTTTTNEDGISGKYSVKCPGFAEEQYGKKAMTFSISLCLSSTTKHVWGKFDFDTYQGYLRSFEPYESGKRLYFEIRGHETGESEQFCNIDEADSWIELDEKAKTMKGVIDKVPWWVEAHAFTGKRINGKPLTVKYCKEQFRSNNEWNQSHRISYHGWDYSGGVDGAEAAYESDTTQESDVEDLRKKVKEAQDKRAAEREAKKANEGENGVTKEAAPVEKGKRKQRADGNEDDDDEDDDDDEWDDEEDDEDREETQSWLVLRDVAAIDEDEAIPYTKGNLSYDVEGFKAFGHKKLESDEVMKLVNDDNASKTGLLTELRAQLAHYDLPDCKTISAAKEAIKEAYEKGGNKLETNIMQDMKSYDFEMQFAAVQIMGSTTKLAKYYEDKYKKGSTKHKPSTESILVRVGRERAKEAMRKQQQMRAGAENWSQPQTSTSKKARVY